jgi:hypothetical protein
MKRFGMSEEPTGTPSMTGGEQTLTRTQRTGSAVSFAIVAAQTEKNSSNGRLSDNGIKQSILPAPLLWSLGDPVVKEKPPADLTIAGHRSISLRRLRFDTPTMSPSRSARRWDLPRHPPSSHPERGELWGRSFRISVWSLGRHSRARLRTSPARHSSPPESPIDRHQSLRAFFIRHSRTETARRRAHLLPARPHLIPSTSSIFKLGPEQHLSKRRRGGASVLLPKAFGSDYFAGIG